MQSSQVSSGGSFRMNASGNIEMLVTVWQVSYVSQAHRIQPA